jgi:hypothetical protein
MFEVILSPEALAFYAAADRLLGKSLRWLAAEVSARKLPNDY